MWVNVKDLLPPDDHDVICFNAPSKRRFVGSYHERDSTPERPMWCDEECTYVAVTHWQLWPGDPA